jgi:hypothetical protein
MNNTRCVDSVTVQQNARASTILWIFRDGSRQFDWLSVFTARNLVLDSNFAVWSCSSCCSALARSFNGEVDGLLALTNLTRLSISTSNDITNESISRLLRLNEFRTIVTIMATWRNCPLCIYCATMWYEDWNQWLAESDTAESMR